MAVEGVNGQQTLAAADVPDEEAMAEATAAFGQAIGTAIFSSAMNVVGQLSEQLAELEKEE